MEEKSLFTYWKEAFTQNFFNIEGRARRKEYWGFTLFQSIIVLCFFYAMSLSTDLNELMTDPYAKYKSVAGMLYLIFGIASFLPGLGLTVRRLHDTDKSGLLFLLIFIPILGAIALLILMCIDGDPHSNEYGEDPKGRGLEV